MNLTDNRTKGFTVGWNCFQTELAYDPTQNQSYDLSITSYHQNVGSIELEGNYMSSSAGRIIGSAASTSSSGLDLGIFSKGNITTLQDSAKQWLISNLSIGGDKKPIKNVLANTAVAIANNDIKTIVEQGLGFIFSSLTGSKSSTPTTNYTLEFKTTGSVTIKGRTQEPRTTAIPPLKIMGGLPYPLGIWNLSVPPTLSIGRYAKASNAKWNPTYSKYAQLVYFVERKLDPSKFAVVMNPFVKAFVKSTTINYSLSTGHLLNENYNVTSASRKALVDKYNNKSSYRLIPETYKMGLTPILRYNSGDSVKIYHTTPSQLPLVRFFSQPNVGIVPGFKNYGDGAPYHDITTQNTAVDSEDVKVLIEYVITVNGKDRAFYSIRTFDPDIEFYINASPCVPYNWTKEEIAKYFNL